MKKNHTLEILLAISLIVLIVFVIFGDKIKQNSCLWYRIFNTIFSLGLAYIASYIFYCVTVKSKERKDKKNIYPYISELNKQIINCGSCVFTTVVKAAGKELSEFNKETISEEEYKALCKQVNMDYQSDVDDGIKHLGCKTTGYDITDDIYYSSIKSVQQLIKTILAFSPHIETDLIKILNDINASQLIQNSFKFDYVKLDDFIKDIAKDMYDYLKKINELEDYNENVVKKGSRKLYRVGNKQLTKIKKT